MSSKPEFQVSIIIPVYNEEEAIPKVITDTRREMNKTGWTYEILIVDDGSKDNTVAICEKMGVRVVSHKRNRGCGAARTTGILAAKGDVIVFTDGDDTYPAEFMPNVIRPVLEEGYDHVLGARKSEKGTSRWLRAPVKRMIRALAIILTWTHIPDLNTGLRAFKRSIGLQFLYLLPTTHSWVSTITLATIFGHKDVLFVPIDYRPRLGRSTFHPIKDTYNYFGLIIRSCMYFNPLRIFLPLAIVFFSVGGFSSVVHYLHQGQMVFSDLFLLIVGMLLVVVGLLADLIVVQGRRLPRI